MLNTIDTIRLEASKKLDQGKRSEFGQFMTPAAIAKFMAGLFKRVSGNQVRLLDAGAGIGSLTIAFLENILNRQSSNCTVNLTMYEIDTLLASYLESNISEYSQIFKNRNIHFEESLLNTDFINDAVLKIKSKEPGYTHAILNPPYKKINSSSLHRKLLSSVNFETVNLYSAFVGLALMMLEEHGELVAIIPRSFCNGNYYKAFRKLIIENSAIRQIHLFSSRTQAFKDDNVLQENIIIHLEKAGTQNDVIISNSTSGDLLDYQESSFAFNQIIKENDTEYFIHIPIEENELDNSENVIYTLLDLGVEVSTGPVVDFRAKEHIFMESKSDTVPLLYPNHFNCKEIEWPKKGKKPNAISCNEETKKMLYPTGFYTLVRRFSSKEEKQRIVARVINPDLLKSEYIGLENHLNVFHFKKKGIDGNLAYGLAAYLNSSYVDTHFRTFNGHTQVNVTDLKQMKYPSKEILAKLGQWAMKQESFVQSEIDKEIRKFL